MLTVSASSAGISSLIAGKKTRQTRGYANQVAAQIILHNYLDSRAQQKAAGGFFTKNLD
jgi:RNase H-fold protein (predicted Holliday junction resolvase)